MIKRTFDFVSENLSTESYHCAKFDAYRSYESEDVTFLFYRMTSRDLVIKRTYDFVSGSPST